MMCVSTAQHRSELGSLRDYSVPIVIFRSLLDVYCLSSSDLVEFVNRLLFMAKLALLKLLPSSKIPKELNSKPTSSLDRCIGLRASARVIASGTLVLSVHPCLRNHYPPAVVGYGDKYQAYTMYCSLGTVSIIEPASYG